MSRILATTLRAVTRPTLALAAARPTTQIRLSSSGHTQETFESFSTRYIAFFTAAQDLFEVQRGLNNCFAHDLVPSPGVIEAALRAARRVDDYATAVRVFEGIKEKVENKEQYKAYLEELKGVREELGGCPTFYFLTRRATLIPLIGQQA
jgi:cytochrome c oxidase subunit 5a